MIDDRRARYLALFAAESRSLLADGHRTVAAWREQPGELSHAEGVFRALHTVKGMAASLGFEELTALVHATETDLAEVTNGSRAADIDWLDNLAEALDRITIGADTVIGAEPDGPADDGDRTGAAGPAGAVVRVDTSRLDALLEDLGAMVTARQELERHATAESLSPVARSALAMSRRLDALQDRILHVRLAPIGEVLERIPPLVRDLARRLDKSLAVEVAGEEIEVDRAILSQLLEPLVHLVRNAVDHGLETPEERLAAGKSEIGKVTVRAWQERDAVVVELADDGRGISSDLIAQRAREQGILAPQATLSNDGLLAILARPGFSTARQVSDVSGRGVGLDTVVARLHRVGAAVSMETTPGEGTTFRLRLPTRLGIVRSLVTAIGDERYVMPLTHVHELIAWEASESRMEGNRMVLDHRGESIPVLDLRRLVQFRGAPPPPQRPAVVFDAHGRKVALLSDQIHGQIDAVVQPIDRPLGMPRWITGATVLDDGRPAMMLDVAAVA